MVVNAVSSTMVQSNNILKSKVTNPITEKIEEKQESNGYAPITASLWGIKGNKQENNQPLFSIPTQTNMDFGASRPTNNPKDFPSIEADTQNGFKLSTLTTPMICPDCGRPIMTKPIFAAIKKELDETEPTKYLDVIEKHSEFLLPQEQHIVKFLRQKQDENPNITIRDIVSGEREHRLDSLEAQQYAIMDRIEALSEDLPYHERSRLTYLTVASCGMIFERNNSYAFQRSKFLEQVDNLDISSKETKAKIRAIAEELPSSMNNEDAWYVKYGGMNFNKKQPYTARDVAEKLLAPAYTNTDHVHPWNRGGYDAVSNFWLMHARCNIIKTDKPFTEWLYEDKLNRVDYIKQYLTDAQKAIDESNDSKIQEKYGLYSAKLAKTIYYETNGEVDFTEDFPLPEGYDVPVPEDNKKKKAA
ncbi:HNH endonuclease [bacterium]|nr:HNH endonuclease [bacterium]